MKMKWLAEMFGLQASKPIVNERSVKNGESITKDEGEFIVYCVKHNLPPCPDCQEGYLLKGPQGGSSVNCLCNNCLSEFNLCWVFENQVVGERISDAGINSQERCSQIYGI
jgi:hypothetical protein